MQGKRVLVIDDEPQMGQLMSTILTAEGAEVETARSGEEGLRRIRDRLPDLVFVDILLPGLDGWELCRRIREDSEIPIIILSVLSGNKEIVRGFDVGADDYVTKPFEREILLARARSVLRRSEFLVKSAEMDAYDDGYLFIDLNTRQLLVDGEPVRLSRTEFRLLSYLLENLNEVVTFEGILKRVWGEQYRFNAEYVHVYIWHLRKKLEPNPAQPIYLISEHSIGYRFIDNRNR